MDAIVVENLRKEYNGVLALKDVSFNVREGEIFGLLGPNGAGKTTLTNAIAGVIKPSSGRIIIYGVEMRENTYNVKRRIGFCPQETTLYEDLNAIENLMFYAGLYGVSRREARKKALELLDFVDLKKEAKKLVAKYSGGMKRKLNLACALIHDPDILLLDEPTVGFDPASRHEVWDKINELKKAGKTIVLTTHYMDEADRLSDRVAIMNEGEIIAIDTPENLKKTVGELSIIEVEFYEKVSGVEDKLAEYSENRKVLSKEKSVRVYVKDANAMLPRIVEECIKFGARISRVDVSEPTLEDVFLKLTGKRLSKEV